MVGRPFAAFSQDGNMLVSSSGSHSLQTIDPRTGKLVSEHQLKGECERMVRNDQRTKLAIALQKNHDDVVESVITIVRLSEDTIQEPARFALGDAKVTCLDFAHDNRDIAIGDSVGRIHRVDLARGTVSTKRLHFKTVLGVKFSPDGQRLATTGFDCHTHLLRRAESMRVQPLVTRLQRAKPEIGFHVDFLDHVGTVCSSNGPNQIDLWDANSGEILKTLQLAEVPWNCVRFGADRDRERLAIVRANWPPTINTDEVVIWDGISGKFGSKHFRVPQGVVATVVPFSPDGRYVGVTGPGHATLIDLVQQTTRKIEFSDWVKSCAFSNDGKTFAVAPTDGPIHFYDVETLTEVRSPLMMDSVSTGSIRYAPKGNVLASTGFEGCFNLRDVGTGERILVGERSPRYLATLAFSPDGGRIATGAMDGRIRVFSTETGDELFSTDVEAYYSYVSFSSDGQSLAIVSERDRLVIHAPEQTTIAQLNRSELGDIICRGVTFYERPNPHRTAEDSQ
jgi:WD40 repeat protein